jgi:hypothetical protein
MSWMTDVQRGLAWAILICFIAIVIVFGIFSAIGKLPDPILDVFKQVVTALINVVMVVIGYFFGSSTGSKDKDDTLNSIVTKAQVNPDPVAAAAVVAASTAAKAAVADALTQHDNLPPHP